MYVRIEWDEKLKRATLIIERTKAEMAEGYEI
jgi:hypothetical protein